MTVERLWKITLSILLAFTVGLILWSGLVSRPVNVSANGGIDWPEIQLVQFKTGLISRSTSPTPVTAAAAFLWSNRVG
jgi:hypothetical protein